jgi:hypothetical protein
MKKYYLSIIAAILAISISAFSAMEKKTADRTDGLYWYNSITGTEFPNNPQVNPPSGCEANGSNCALGFTTVQTDPVGNASNASDRRSQNSQ